MVRICSGCEVGALKYILEERAEALGGDLQPR